MSRCWSTWREGGEGEGEEAALWSLSWHVGGVVGVEIRMLEVPRNVDMQDMMPGTMRGVLQSGVITHPPKSFHVTLASYLAQAILFDTL